MCSLDTHKQTKEKGPGATDYLAGALGGFFLVIVVAVAGYVAFLGMRKAQEWGFLYRSPKTAHYLSQPPEKIFRIKAAEYNTAIEVAEQTGREKVTTDPTDEELVAILKLAAQRAKASEDGTVCDFVVISGADFEKAMDSAREQGHKDADAMWAADLAEMGIRLNAKPGGEHGK